ncbi:glycosyltransferase [Pseudocitrobacter faecalis]|nr:glycosyltransferase [Pseudocitrobacter faecalis]
MTTENPLISIYMPTWNRQQLAIRAIKSVLRQDYPNWEMIIVDDCSESYEQLQQFVSELNDPRVCYIHNDVNSGACAVRNQAIMQSKGQFITGIDDDDEWTPNRLSVFLAQKHQLVTHAFLYANDYLCQGKSTRSPRACRCIRNRRFPASCSTNAILSATRCLARRGVLKSACSIHN